MIEDQGISAWIETRDLIQGSEALLYLRLSKKEATSLSHQFKQAIIEQLEFQHKLEKQIVKFNKQF